LTPDQPFSESENRVLDKLPAFSLHSLESGKFASRYESYVSDQFAFRDTWVGAKTDADRALGKKDNNGVFLGKDGRLIERYISPLEADLEERIKAILKVDQASPDLRKYMMIVPTAASLLSSELPAYAPVGDEMADLNRIHQLLPQHIRFVDVYSALSARQEQAIFYRTDHHWTTFGAYYAYLELCKSMRIVPHDIATFDIRQVTHEFYGSLYSKSGFRHLKPDEIDLFLPKSENKIKVIYEDDGDISESLYDMDSLGKKDKYAVFLNGNHALIRIATDGPADKKLLVVKDSYANSLIPFLAQHFGEINVVDLRYYEDSLLKLVQERQINDMIILYNIKTFFEDASILNITEGIQ
jgi:hypothetical protein